VLVAHACNPSFSGGTDQEDYSSKPAEANSSRDPILKKAIKKRAGGMAQGVGSEFKPQNQKPKTKNQNKKTSRGFFAEQRASLGPTSLGDLTQTSLSNLARLG
jgi:hypothetical protein